MLQQRWSLLSPDRCPEWLTLERVDEAGVHGFRLVQRHSATGDIAGDFGVFIADQNAAAIANLLLQEPRP